MCLFVFCNFVFFLRLNSVPEIRNSPIGDENKRGISGGKLDILFSVFSTVLSVVDHSEKHTSCQHLSLSLSLSLSVQDHHILSHI